MPVGHAVVGVGSRWRPDVGTTLVWAASGTGGNGGQFGVSALFSFAAGFAGLELNHVLSLWVCLSLTDSLEGKQTNNDKSALAFQESVYD